MERLNRYPRGALVRLASTALQIDMGAVDVADVEKDTVIDDLHRLYISNSVNRDSWRFRKVVIARCSQLYGDFYRWLALQLGGNDNIYDLSLDFILDTVKFIRTGHRDMSVRNWYELLLEYPDPHRGIAGPQRTKQLNIVDPREFDNFIGVWCSHPNGFEDMLWATYVFFGASKSNKRIEPTI